MPDRAQEIVEKLVPPIHDSTLGTDIDAAITVSLIEEEYENIRSLIVRYAVDAVRAYAAEVERGVWIEAAVFALDADEIDWQLGTAENVSHILIALAEKFRRRAQGRDG